MKTNIKRLLASLLSVFIFLAAFHILVIYIHPMESFSLDLSLSPQGEAIFEKNFDQKGWTVYQQTKKKKKKLIPNGFGDYSGVKPGETFYYSRVLEETLDSPTLRIGPSGDASLSIFLDDVLIYTDHPELDNRIGYLELPTNDVFRDDPIIISLPVDYQGKTLTIAQSLPMLSDASTFMATPVPVTLYCGYAYESELIAESFRTAIFATLAFVTCLILLLTFIHTPNFGTFSLAFIPFVLMMIYLKDTSFFDNYFGPQSYNIRGPLLQIICGITLIFLWTRAGRYKRIISILPLIYIISFIGNQSENLREWIFFVSLLLLLILGFLFWRKENFFYQIFIPTTILAIGGYWTYIIATDTQAIEHFLANLTARSITYVHYRTFPPAIITMILSAIYEAFRREINHRTEQRMILEHQEMALESYKNLKNQHKEVMMLRHDMNRHFQLLSEMDDTVRIKAYLNELIGQNEKVRSVVLSGNETLDIILNGKLNKAINAGIKVEIEKAEAPNELPLSDTDLCSLLMNILDNAITAASKADVEHPYLRLNIHLKDHFLSIFCENSADNNTVKKEVPTYSLQKHGLGIKIMKDITKRYEGILDTEYGKDYYKIQIAIPVN